MSTIMLRPDLKTSGGEIHDILINGRYAGNMTLVYREHDRIGGAVQLDRTSISASEKRQVVSYVQHYVQDLIMAVRAADCDVVVTISPYDHIIATSRDELGQPKIIDDLLMDEDNEPVISDEEPDRLDRIEMRRTAGRRHSGKRAKRKPAVFELVIVGESRNKVEYHVYNHDMEWVAEAFFRVSGTHCVGDIDFMYMPSEDEIEAVADLIVSDFDDEAIDSFDIRVLHKKRELEHIRLTHEELMDAASVQADGEPDSDDFTITLARDDGDILTYEIYHQPQGGLPIGTATVDITNRQLSGFIDFRDPCSEEEREIIAALLMRELDKEKEYNTLNLSVMHRNEKIDEMLFESETETVH